MTAVKHNTWVTVTAEYSFIFCMWYKYFSSSNIYFVSNVVISLNRKRKHVFDTNYCSDLANSQVPSPTYDLDNFSTPMSICMRIIGSIEKQELSRDTGNISDWSSVTKRLLLTFFQDFLYIRLFLRNPRTYPLLELAGKIFSPQQQ